MLNYPNMEVSLIVLNGGRNGDALFTRELYKKLLFKEGVKIYNYSPIPGDIIAHIAGCSYFVGMRYHAGLYAYMTQTPQIIIEYMPKCHGFAQDIGAKSMTIESLLAGDLRWAIDDMIKSPDKYLPARPLSDYKSRAWGIYQNYKGELYAQNKTKKRTCTRGGY